MPEKVFIRPEFLKDIFVVIEFKVESLKFFFQCTKILPHYLLAFIVSYKKSSIILIFLLYLMHLCSLATYKIFSLALVSSNFVIICFGIIFFMFLVFGVYRDSWIRKFIIFMNLEIFPTILFLNRFFFQRSFRFHSKIERRAQRVPTYLLSLPPIPPHTASPPHPINILLQSNTFVTIGESTLTHYCHHPKSIGYIKVDFW